ncbi:helix-turn-helix transcriptional regulator [Bacillaceae bacterium SIJ1]|uniref:helix-turn-helix domain-containing protein n=1 Tax=Litoribacterium kuwaitense TaxID=1398745 RepID=UPI0013EC8685|nr:helix-turn-helix domain-containing protein [Litoribacterium kuwaitense]NGP46643.1 helix-turn-helix transcriptional regulator [Litoribacterium kuwaitense]
MKEKSYQHLVQHVLGDFSGANYIFDPSGQLITASKNRLPVTAAEIKQLADEGQEEVIHQKIAGENYSITHIRSDITGWTFISAMPTKQFFGKLNALQQTILYILVAIALIGITMITIVSSRQYKPLQNLVNLLKTRQVIDANHLARHPKDELTSLRESILYMSDRSEKLHLKVEHQAPYVRDQLLLQLLRGHGENRTDLIEMLSDIGVVFNKRYVFVILITKQEDDASLSLEQKPLYTTLKKFTFENCIGYGLDLPDDNGFSLIVNIENEADQRHFVSGIVEQLEDMIDENDGGFSIGVGQVYTELGKVNRSFVEATAATEYALITNQGSCIYFEQIVQQTNTNTWFPLNLQVKLSQSLKQGDYIVASETINEILHYTVSIRASIYMTKAMTYDLINTMLKVIAEKNLLYDVTDIKELFKSQSLDELSEALDHVAIFICKEVNQKKRKQLNQLNHQLMDYLQKEFANPELSLEKLADYLNLSVPYASRFIKEQTGYTFTQIIWDLRMKECKRLLVHTSAPIKDIVKQIGYVDVANFSRKFKKEVGMTPSQFRKKQMDAAL